MTGPRRFVEFVVVSDQLTTDELIARLGPADESIRGTARFPNDHAWVIKRSSDSDVGVDELISSVLERVAVLRGEVADLHQSGAHTVLRVVLHIGPAEAVGPGFVLDASMMELMSEVGAFLDADLYYAGPEDEGAL